MSNINKLLVEYKKKISKPVDKIIDKNKLYDFIYPIKIEKINDEYHLYIMLHLNVNSGCHYSSGIINCSSVDNLILNTFSIIFNSKINKFTEIFPLNESKSTTGYIIDGSKFDVDMLNYLWKIKYNNFCKYRWINIEYINIIKISDTAKEAIKLIKELIIKDQLMI
jgi:hypothetical protein